MTPVADEKVEANEEGEKGANQEGDGNTGGVEEEGEGQGQEGAGGDTNHFVRSDKYLEMMYAEKDEKKKLELYCQYQQQKFVDRQAANLELIKQGQGSSKNAEIIRELLILAGQIKDDRVKEEPKKE